jgi:hypothetical protein
MNAPDYPQPSAFHSALLAALLILTSGCASQRIFAPGQELAQQSYSVQGLKDLSELGFVEFGPWTADNISWSWQGQIIRDGKDQGQGDKTVKTFSRTFEFTVQENDSQIWDVFCRHEMNRKHVDESLTGVRSSRRSYLHCRLEAADGSGRVASLHVVNRDDRPMSGSIGFEQSMIEVNGKSRNGFPGGRSGTAGYQFRYDREVVSAIEIMRNGRVWIHPSVSPDHQHIISASAMALLLHDEILAQR